ncbi:MAG TPA: diguanylate cyclase [Polyangiales bacterium]|nr:diguanylate cyclase [Polyangiales bacterium]
MPDRSTPVQRLEAVIAAQRDVIACGLDLQRVMDVTTRCARALTSSAAAVVELREGEEMVYRAVSGSAEGTLGTRLPMQGSSSGRSVLASRTMHTPDTEEDPDVNREACRRVGARSMICVPLRSDGTTVGVLKVYSPQPHYFRSEDVGTLELMAGLISTATANAVAQDALLMSEQRFRAVAEAAFDSIITADRQGRVMFWNPSATRMFGWRPEEIIGKPIAELMPQRYVDGGDPDRTGFDEERMKKAVGRTVTLKGVRRDGSEFPLELSASVWHAGEQRFYTSIVRDISERRALELQVLKLARTDHLTGLLTRGAGEEALGREVERARRYRRVLSCLLLDVDHFKKINDTAGHAAGDQVLRTLGQIVLRRIRSSDVAVRWGGEEFLIVLPETPGTGACELAESLRATVELGDFEVVSRVTVSIGCAELHPDEPREQTLARADKHLYTAKANGRNRVEG